MALFQKSVLANHINSITESEIVSGWEKFQDYKSISENIRNYKEEEFQYKFLEMLFVDCLGYKISDVGDEKRNLFTEVKNVSDSKKADGAIKKDDEVIAVIELKSTKTKDFKTIEEQAFGYKVNQPKCKYVITSNFEKLRFYIIDATEFEEFDLFNLNQNDFKLLHVCLHIDNIFNGIPEKLKKDSVFEEEKITKKLYKDYSDFRNEVFNNLIENNSEHNKLLLFNKTQKLLDRFLFIFFAEDKNLVPANSISKIITKWESDIAFGDKRSLYSIFKQYFHVLNVGRPARGKYESIFAYNGGLFSEDEVLDNIKIDDKILLRHTKNLSHYDFESDVSVNILGHIFEHSLSEIEEIQNEISGLQIETSKRKKDGVFYTPTYITKYIIENTLGKLCLEKKTKLEINEEVYTQRKARSQKRIDNLNEYREWLLQLTICDPACGSGAFLVQALDFLIDEHKYIDELNAVYHGASIPFSDITSSILENNLYGVDINGESVEIAKLSLWLRTAQKGRKLSNLNNNIKCGNSLIDDPLVAGDKAFNWKKEYPEIFANSGFDIVIGNPPYVLCQPSNTIESILNYYKTFEVASYKIDLFHLFFEKSISLLKRDGRLGFITPNTYLNNKYIKPLRSYILAHSSINSLINYKDEIFIDAGVDVATIILTKRKIIGNTIELYEVENSIQKHLGTKAQTLWEDDKENLFNLNKEFDIKLNNCVLLGGVSSVTFGLQTKDKKTFVSVKKNSDNWESCYTGKDVSRYYLENSSLYFLNQPEEVKAGGSWNMDIHHSKKIVVRQVGNPEPIFAFDKYGYATLNTMYSIVLTEKEYSYYYILSILNSKLIKSYFLSKYSDGKQLFPKIKGFQLKELPVKVANKKEQTPFIEKADQMLSLNKNLQELSSKFQRILQRKFEGLEKLPNRLESWYELTFTDFVKELKKKKIKLSLSEEAEWEDYFIVEKQKAIEIKAEIIKTDKEIDQMVYELYGLTKEEIDIVENMNVS